MRLQAPDPWERRELFALAALLIVLACSGSESIGPSTGGLEITAATTGADLDSDGYTVAVDGGPGVTLPTNGSRTIATLSVGNHSVALRGVATNCAVSGQNPTAVTVTSGVTARVTFQISCARSNRILFERRAGGLYTVNPDGSNPIALIGGFEPGWSPNYQQVVFVVDIDLFSGIYGVAMANADGSNPQLLTSPHDVQGAELPSWSPDGSKIVFDDFDSGDIWLIDTTGTNLVSLTSGRDTSYWGPKWSPDGSKIALVAEPRAGGYEIHLMNADGTNPINLSTSPAQDIRPTWSPDGSKIAFSSKRDGNWEIYVMNADGTGVKRLTNNPAEDDAPSWSPDGTKIVFSSDRVDGNFELYVMSAADGSGVVRITNFFADDGNPAWWR